MKPTEALEKLNKAQEELDKLEKELPTAQECTRKEKHQTEEYRDWETDRKSTRLNSSHSAKSRMPSSA